MEITKRDAPSYARCFLSLALGLSPIFLLMGIASLFGANTVQANGQNVYGFTGIIVALILNVVFAAVLAGLQKLGFVLLGLFRGKDKVTA